MSEGKAERMSEDRQICQKECQKMCQKLNESFYHPFMLGILEFKLVVII